MPWDNTGTSSTTYTIIDDMHHMNEYYEKPKGKKPKKLEYCSEPLGKIVAANIISGHISLFAHRGSSVFKDTALLNHNNIFPYFDDPVIPGYGKPTAFSLYSFSIVIDALEYMSGKMAKANLIKEALLTLKSKLSNPYVMILAKTRKMVEELAKNNKYEELKNKNKNFEQPKGLK